MLSDGKPHPIEEIYRTTIPTEHLKPLLQYITDEEIFLFKDGYIATKD